MKLTVLLLTFAFLQVHATSTAQSVSISGRNITLRQVFGTIKKQTGYVLFANESDLLHAKRVSLSVQDIPLTVLLELIFRDQPVGYSITGKTIVLSRKEPTISILPGAALSAPYAPPIRIKVTDSAGTPLSGISVSLKKAKLLGVTDAEGGFSANVQVGDVLVFSSVGFEPVERVVADESPIMIVLKLSVKELEDVTVQVNTGYQTVAKERATGSFSQVDKKQLDNRVSVNILDKLEGLSTGLVFSRSVTSDESKLSIRGRSTLFSEDQPLIVVNGFPIEGDINSIDPDDVESVTLLKDAAAASIWGVRAANGVIVITTRQGKFNQRPQTEFRSNLVVGERPDFNALRLMSSSDYIDAQQVLFNASRYNNLFFPGNITPVPEAVQIWQDAKNGIISSAEAEQKINALRSIEILDDYKRLFTRSAVLQQYQFSVNGGSSNTQYYLSGGYDKNARFMKGDNMERFTLNSSNNIRLSKKINILLAAQFAQSTRVNPQGVGDNATPVFDLVTGVRNASLSAASIPPPYTRLVDEQGRPLSVDKYSKSFQEEVLQQGLLNSDYYPVSEYDLANRRIKTTSMNIRLGGTWELAKGVSLDASYNLERNYSADRNLQDKNALFVRENVNLFTEFASGGELIRRLPHGDILTTAKNELNAHTLRARLNLNRTWSGKHEVAAILGAEKREIVRDGNTQTLFGYNDLTLQYVDVDMATMFPVYWGYYSSIGSVFVNAPVSYIKDRFLSYFSNGSYTYLGKYTVSASGRLDGSNLFGVQRNKQINPLWSVGAGWQLHKEKFFSPAWVNSLKLRATYGFNGNINKTATAFTTAMIHNGSGNAVNSIPYASIVNPANPNLRWEKVGQLNLGADFTIFNNVISGSVDYFNKNAKDLFGNEILAPSAGFDALYSNVAKMRTRGWELKVDSRNVSHRSFSWTTTFMLSVAKDKVLDYYAANMLSPARYLMYGGRDDNDRSNYLPVPGYSMFGLWAYPYGGLNEMGNATIISPSGEVLTTRPQASAQYNSIYQLKYMGAVNPPVFGSLRNTVGFRQLSLTVNMLYKMGHVYRGGDIGYYTMAVAYQRGPDTFHDRWKQPGDEARTNVPAFTGQREQDRVNNDFYNYSDANVFKADHIRLQDILLNYELNKQVIRDLPVARIIFYAQSSNVGIIWRANDHGVDPDYAPQSFSSVLPPARSWTIGAKIEF